LLLCPYGITKGDLKLPDSKVPSQAIAMKKVEKHSLPNLWQDSVVNAEPAIATDVLNSYRLLISMKKFNRQFLGGATGHYAHDHLDIISDSLHGRSHTNHNS
jgi:hypothetical protein